MEEGWGRKIASLNAKGISLTDAGKYPEAIRAFSEALAIDPGLAGVLFNRAEAERLSGEFQAAEADLEAALSLCPSDPDYLHAQGLLAYDREDFEAADAFFDRVLSLRPDHSQAWNDKGIIRFRRGDYGAARSCFEKAVAAEPALEEGWFNLADTYDELGMRTEQREARRRLAALGAGGDKEDEAEGRA